MQVTIEEPRVPRDLHRVWGAIDVVENFKYITQRQVNTCVDV